MKTAFALCGIAAMGLILLGLKQVEQKPLLERAKRVGVVPAGTISYNEQVQDFFPLSSKELLFIQRTTNTEEERPKIVEGNWVSSMRVFRVNLATKKVKRETRLEKAISEWYWSFVPSPDGKWLLCRSRDEKWPNRIVNLKTGAVRKAPLTSMSDTVWFPSGETLLTTVYPKSGGGGAFDVKAPTPYLRAFTFSRANPGRTKPYAFEYGKAIDPRFAAMPYWGAPVVITPDKRLLTVFSYQATATHPWHEVIRISEFAIRGSQLVLLHRYLIEPPDSMVYDNVVRINPQGTRVLWQGCEQTTNTVKSWSFSTSNLDGSDRRDYDKIVIPSKNEPYRPEIVWEENFGAEWLPDGKTICFIANRNIYTISDK